MTVRPQYVCLLIQYDQIGLRVVTSIITDEDPTTQSKVTVVLFLQWILLYGRNFVYFIAVFSDMTKSFTKSFKKIINWPESQK